MNALEELRSILKGKDWVFDGLAGGDLWALISALRGPDDDNYELKTRTTLRIRNAIEPDFFLATYGYAEKPDRGTPYEIVSKLLKEFPDADRHFLEHYATACEVYWRLENK